MFEEDQQWVRGDSHKQAISVDLDEGADTNEEEDEGNEELNTHESYGDNSHAITTVTDESNAPESSH